jgi:5-methylthioadenosine/S-adenosylhomocysteine deaminase
VRPSNLSDPIRVRYAAPRHAIFEGAHAVGLGAVTGEIAVGKRADFLIVDINVPELCPSVDLDWDLVRLGNCDQIDAVSVEGTMRLWCGWPIDSDGRALVDDLREHVSRAIGSAPIQRIHPLSAVDRRRRLARRESSDKPTNESGIAQ